MDYLDESDVSESKPPYTVGCTITKNLILNKLNEPSSINNKFFVNDNRFNNFSTTTKVIENKKL